jgi:hypothetical protein
VLTEWKKNENKKPESNFLTARGQGNRYTKGVLAGNELTTYRYAVLVSEKHVDTPSDLAENGVVWRHINIAVDPEPPSKS